MIGNPPSDDILKEDKVHKSRFELKISGLILDVEGSEKFLEEHIIPYLNAWMKSQAEQVQGELLALHDGLLHDLASLEDHFGSLSQAAADFAEAAGAFHKSTAELLEEVQDLKGSSDELVAAARSMSEMQMSFNLQYLLLQNKISHENRQFSTISNIMKNKHDTAKNSINNIR